jgi:hypothetical protein
MDAELEQELGFHLDNQVVENLAAGMTHQEAMRHARMVVGGMDQIREEDHEARGTYLLESTLQDMRYGLRAMGKQPMFFIIAALTLSLGIGASTAVFSLVNTVLLQPSPYPNAAHVMMLWREVSLAGIGDVPWAPDEFRIVAQAATAFQHLGAFRKKTFNLTGGSNPELLEGVQASTGFFPALGASPLLGRTFTGDEDQPGHDHVVVLSNRLWQDRCGGNTGILGRTLDLSGSHYTVIGVMPASFRFPNQEGIPRSLIFRKKPSFGCRWPWSAHRLQQATLAS